MSLTTIPGEKLMFSGINMNKRSSTDKISETWRTGCYCDAQPLKEKFIVVYILLVMNAKPELF